MKHNKLKFILILGLFFISFIAKSSTILNVSYDPTRQLYQEINPIFAQAWREKTGQIVNIEQSHGGSGKQTRAVIDGLDADVVSLALSYDIDAIANAGLVDKNWQKQFPNRSTPYTSTIVFLVRKGNPKNIKDWADLVRPGVEIITPNPKTSGAARWTYLAAWGFALTKSGNENEARSFVKSLYRNTKIMPSAAREATTIFAVKGLGDVLVSWENEAFLVSDRFKGQFEIVIPSKSILVEPSVAIVDKVVDRKKTREQALAYLNFLYTKPAQEIIAKNYYRPTDKDILKKYQAQFKQLALFTVDEMFGGWQKAHNVHFKEKGVFDQLIESK